MKKFLKVAFLRLFKKANVLKPSLQIRTKVLHITVTNVCNLACGGCNQLCGHFPKEKLFFISLEELRNNIETSIKVAKDFWNKSYFPPRHRHFSLYGGEPTLHPQWNEILKILYEEYSDWPFVILTNGRTFRDKKFPVTGYEKYDYIRCRKDIVAHDRNVFWRIDYKDEPRDFVPTLIAPIDLFENKDQLSYFRLAEKHCSFYQRCETLIYQNKGYFCINAGPMDAIYHNGANGWKIEKGKNPFLRTDEEVETQAKLFCHRCNWSVFSAAGVLQPGLKGMLKQSISEKSFVSKTNEVGIKLGTFNLVQFERSCYKNKFENI